jgi:hypothetical protein
MGINDDDHDKVKNGVHSNAETLSSGTKLRYRLGINLKEFNRKWLHFQGSLSN